MTNNIFRFQTIAKAAHKDGSVGNLAQRLSQLFKGAKGVLTVEEVQSSVKYVKQQSAKAERLLLDELNHIKNKAA